MNRFTQAAFAAGLALAAGTGAVQAQTEPNPLPDWALGGFVRPQTEKALIEPTNNIFHCPMSDSDVTWEAADTFNPASVVKDGKIYVLYRAEDNANAGLGARTSRIGMFITEDGITQTERKTTPVFYPDGSEFSRTYEQNAEHSAGGCEDPRVVAAKKADGSVFYVMTYTAWNRNTARLAIATSDDLMTWEKRGIAFLTPYGGKFKDLFCKSGSIVTKVDEDGNQYAAKVKINGEEKYLMYWGEDAVYAAVSDDLVNWTPIVEGENNDLKKLIKPRDFYFDSNLTECGPPAVVTDKGIVLVYNGKNRSDMKGDTSLPGGTYAAGQVLFSLEDPLQPIARLDRPFFRPMASYEKTGQYTNGTVFVEGLSYFKGKWYLYYGCADSKVGVAVYDPNEVTEGDPLGPVAENIPEGVINAFPKFGWGKLRCFIHSCSGHTNDGEHEFFLNTRHWMPGKKWCDNKTEHPWVIWEFTDYYKINRFWFEDARNHEPGSKNTPDWKLEYSLDNDKWTEILHKTNDGGRTFKDESFNPVEVRYLRATFTKADGAVRIYGVDIFGEYSRPIDRGNNLISVGKTILKSYDAVNMRETASNLINGYADSSHKWCFYQASVDDPIKFAVIDLEDTYDIEKIELVDCKGGLENNPNLADLNIYVSNTAPDLDLITPQGDTNTCWNLVASATAAGNQDIKTYTFKSESESGPEAEPKGVKAKAETAPVRARYVKLEVPFFIGETPTNNTFTARVPALNVYGTKYVVGTGVGGIDADDAAISVRTAAGAAVVEASDATVYVYDLAGRLISKKSVNGTAAIELPASIYLVRVVTPAGSKVAKVAIR